jgi:hypothetical protein
MTGQITKIEQQQATNTQAIADINAALNTLVTEFIRPLAKQSVETQRIVDENTKAINVLIEIASEAEAKHVEQSEHVENLLNDAKTDRQVWREGLNEQGKRIESLLSDAKAERLENQRRFDAQMQISQAMLVELARVNSRLEILERAS